MSGRRDFGDLSARLDQHLERLPEYAQRAQERLRHYFPAAGGQRPYPLPRPVVRPSAITDVPAVIGEVRSRWARWNEPAARLARRKRRTSRALTLWILLTLLCGFLAAAAGIGMAAVGGASSVLAGASGMIVFGTLGTRSALRLRQLNRTRLPVRSTPEPLPPAGSAARDPMRRLAECEASLAELLGQLSAPSAAGTTTVPVVSVEDARATAAEAAIALRELATRIQAVERARNAAPGSEHGGLDAAVSTLREQLDDGVDGYGALVAAAGRAVAASGSGVAQSKEALTDATDRLAGLAIALRDLS